MPDPSTRTREAAPAADAASSRHAPGPLTFAFTDIEGSTRLLARLRDRYAEVLAEHSDVVRAEATRWHGSVVDTQGDSFFLVFERASDALGFAVGLQRRLAEHAWPDEAVVRDRIGLHTGQARLGRTGYVGLDVHRAARIASAAHGGQVVISEATRIAVETEPMGAALRDLGPHRLKDLPDPERIFQVEVPGLAVEFPPLRSLDGPDEPPAPGSPPFRGLGSFDVDDAGRYFGREALTEDLLAHLEERDFLAIIGASGSGKSSLARAGLAAAVGRAPDALAGGPWRVRVMTPTDRPVQMLDATLAEVAEDGRPTLLVVDQLEELFTLSDRPHDRATFVERLRAWLLDSGRAKVVVTLRADFYDRLVDLPTLRDAIATDQRYIGPMSQDELRRAVEAPAQAGGWSFVPGLVDLILHDAGDEPGALPLLSHALLETWDRRRGRTMTLKGYGEAGGVSGAIARTADRVVFDRPVADQAIARSIFLRLVEPGDDGRDTRRGAHWSELVPVGASPDQVGSVVDALVSARLITVGDDRVEISHEALITEWPALQGWLDEDREGRRLHRRLTEAAREWDGLGRDPSLLARGSRLSQLGEWADAHRADLNATESAYLAASTILERTEAAEREAQRQRELDAARALAETERQAAVRLRRRAAVLVVALVIAVGALGFAVWQGVEAQRQATIARSRELAASSVAALDADPGLAKLLALRAVEMVDEPPPETIGVLHEAWAADRVVYRRSWEDGTFGPAAMPADLSPSGDRFAVGGVRRFDVIDVATDEVRWSASSGDGVGFGPALHTPDGRWIVTGTVRAPNAEKDPAPEDLGVFVWDAETGVLDRHLAVGGGCGVQPRAVSDRNVLAFTFDAQTGCIGGTIFDGQPVGLAVIDLTSGEVRSLSVDAGGFDSGERGALSSDGRYVAYDDVSSGEARVIVRDLVTGRTVWDVRTATVQDQVETWVRDISDDGRYLLLGDRPIETIDLDTGETVARFGGSNGAANHAGFVPITAGPAARVDLPVLTNGVDGRLVLWDGRWGRQLLSVPATGSGTFSATSDGLVLVQALDAGGDRVADVALVDLGVRSELGGVDGRALGEYWEGGPGDICFALASSLDVGQEQLVFADGCSIYDGEATTQVVDLGGPDGPSFRRSLLGMGSQTIAVAPDGQRFVRGEAEGTDITGVAIRDLATGEVIVDLEGLCAWDLQLERPGASGCLDYPDRPFGMWPRRFRWSPDGSRVAAVGSDGFYAVWDATDGTLLTDDRSAVDVFDIVFSPDAGRLIVAMNGDDGPSIASLTADTWAVESVVPLEADALEFAGFSADGSTLVAVSDALSSQAGTAAIHWFDTRTLREDRAPLSGIHDGAVKDVAVSPSGRLLATASSDGTVRIWEIESGLMIHEIGTGDLEAQGVAFIDDARLAVVARDGSLRIQTLDDQVLVDLVRGSLTRSFTPLECDRYGIDPCPTLTELRGG